MIIMEFHWVTVMKILGVVIATSTTGCALDVHSVRHGTNASVTFLPNVNGYAAVCELFTLSAARPFYVHERIDTSVLRSDQRDRFNVSVEKSDKHLKVTLLISNIQVDDGGVYVLSVRETKDKQEKDYIYDAYVDVVVPPGKAECNVSHSAAGLYEVSCEASAGTDVGGDIVCYQGLEKTVAIGSTVRSSDLITANFMVHAYSPIRCCSVGTNEVKSQDACLDFADDLSRDNVQTNPPRISPSDGLTFAQPSGITTLTKLLRGKEAKSSAPPEAKPVHHMEELSSDPIFKVSMAAANVFVVGVCVVLVCLVLQIRKSLNKFQTVNDGITPLQKDNKTLPI